MRTTAAVMSSSPDTWEVTERELEPPRQGTLLIRMAAAGLWVVDSELR